MRQIPCSWMRRKGWLGHMVVAAALGTVPTTTTAAPQPVSGRVVDTAGTPVNGVRVSNYWAWSGPGEFAPGAALAIDAQGRFEGQLEFYGRPQALVAYSQDGALAGMAIVPADASTDMQITLEPSVHLSGPITCTELDGDPGWVNSYWMPEPNVRPIMATAKDGRIDLRLPRHESWNYWFYGRNVKSVSKEVKIPADAQTHNLGEIDFKATFIALNIGRKVEEWTVTDARGVAIDAAQVPDFKNKWLLVEFWGFW